VSDFGRKLTVLSKVQFSILLCLVLVIIGFIVNSYQQCATIDLLSLVESRGQRTLFRTGNQASCFRKLLHFHHIQSYISIERSLLTESINMSLQSLSSKRGGKSSVLSSSSTISSTNRPQPQRGIDRVDERVLNRLISELGLNRNHTVPDPHCFICRQEKHCGLNRSSLRGVRYTNNSWIICYLQNGLREVVIKVRVSNGSSKYRDSELNHFACGRNSINAKMKGKADQYFGILLLWVPIFETLPPIFSVYRHNAIPPYFPAFIYYHCNGR